MDKIKKLREFITENELMGTQTFNTRNVVGDEMVTIYDDDGIIVDMCYDYGYIEIFGLTEEEYAGLYDLLEIY